MEMTTSVELSVFAATGWWQRYASGLAEVRAALKKRDPLNAGQQYNLSMPGGGSLRLARDASGVLYRLDPPSRYAHGWWWRQDGTQGRLDPDGVQC